MHYSHESFPYNSAAEQVISIGETHGWNIHFDTREVRKSKCIIEAPQGTLILVEQEEPYSGRTFELRMVSKFNNFVYLQKIKSYFVLLDQRTRCGMRSTPMQIGMALKDLEPFVKLEKEWAFSTTTAIEMLLSSSMLHVLFDSAIDQLVLLPEFSFTDPNVKRELAMDAHLAGPDACLKISIRYNGEYKTHRFIPDHFFKLFRTTTLLKNLYGDGPPWTLELLRDIQLQFYTERNLISSDAFACDSELLLS